MSKKVLYDGDIIFQYDSILDTSNLHFYNTGLTLSSIPNNFQFAEDPNPPSAIIVEEETEVTSLQV